MSFDNLLSLLMRNNNNYLDLGGRLRNSVGEGPKFIYLTTGFLRKITVFGLATLLMFGGRVSQMLFGILFLLLMTINV